MAKKKIQSKPTSKKSGTFWTRIRRLFLRIMMWFFIISISWVILLRFIPVYFTPLMAIRVVENLFDGKENHFRRDWVSIEKISPYMPQAVIASEDNLFMDHFGFDFKGIQKAMVHNERKKGKRIHGGSTITQQTAKNVFLNQSRSYIRKGLEAYFTLLIEICWSKERIMEVYLNVIEMGDGIYGVEAASRKYFGKPASELSKSEAALIAVCLPNPRKYSPENPSPYINRRKNKVKSLMNKLPKVEFVETKAE